MSVDIVVVGIVAEKIVFDVVVGKLAILVPAREEGHVNTNDRLTIFIRFKVRHTHPSMETKLQSPSNSTFLDCTTVIIGLINRLINLKCSPPHILSFMKTTISTLISINIMSPVKAVMCLKNKSGLLN